MSCLYRVLLGVFMPCADRQEGKSEGCPGCLGGVVPKDDLFPNLEWLQ